MSRGAEKGAGRPCFRCGKDPADGHASSWAAAEGERWYCHGDDDGVSCFERTQMAEGSLSQVVERLLDTMPEVEQDAGLAEVFDRLAVPSFIRPALIGLLAQAWNEGHRFTGYEPEGGENPYAPSPEVRP